MNTTAFTEIPSEDLLDQDLRRDLTSLDRCDLCGAKAWVRAVMKTSELLFCAHHASAHMDALTRSALFVQDDRAELLEEAAN